MIQVEYFRQLAAIIAEARASLGPLFVELPRLIDSSTADRRLDVGEGRRVREMMKAARELLGRTSPTSRIEDLVERFAGRTSAAQKRALLKQTKAALGVDIFVPDTGIPAVLDGFVSENVSLITSIPEKMFSDIESTITRALQRGTSTRDLTGQISKQFGVARRRAQLIARDQISSLNGQINKHRQTSMGIEKYKWRTSGDERVRKLHASREGVEFEWSNPPSDGHPGEPINCRCTAEPVLSF